MVTGTSFWVLFVTTRAQQDGGRHFVLVFVGGDWSTTRWRPALRFIINCEQEM
jgi:hypothetical protein